MDKAYITIFTPTYNRYKYITGLYETLKKQSCYDFEWLIVDDGADETESYIKKLIEDNNEFIIRYYKKTEERGVARSMNLAISEAKGNLFMKVDDDDELLPGAISKIIKYSKTISEDEKFAGLSCMRAHRDFTVIGENAGLKPGQYIDCTGLERKKKKLRGDKAEVYFTRILRKFYPMPCIKGEYYEWEALLWDRIAHAGYKIRWYGDIIYLTEYLPGGITDTESKARYENFKTYTLLIEQIIEYDEYSIIDKIKHLCRYFEIARKKEMTFSMFGNNFNSHKFIKCSCWTLSLITCHI
jgi:glycosyltransferase involved in cell wall biosynthesis